MSLDEEKNVSVPQPNLTEKLELGPVKSIWNAFKCLIATAL